MPLEVAIIGAGLAGTLSARVLREAHKVTLFERSSTPLEVGAAINIGPNGVRILDTLGFDRALAGSLAVGATRVYNKLGEKQREKFTNYYEQYGGDWLFQHRADLRAEFLRLGTADTASSGIPGADGIKSKVWPLVVAEKSLAVAQPSGLSAFRFTLDLETIKTTLGTVSNVLSRSEPVCLTMYFSFEDTHRSVVMYPCRDFQVLNFVCIAPDSLLTSPTVESWSVAGDRDELLSVVADFSPTIRSYLQMASNIKLWQLRDHDPLPTYVCGRTVFVGDAAHAMTPLQVQGGTQAVEDAEGFRIFFRPGVASNDVPKLLKDFDRVRRP